jgi:hypothetical protein
MRSDKMRKKLAVVVITLGVLTLNVVGSSFAQSTLFKDVPMTFWGFQNVQWAIDNKIIDGYPDGTFKPEENVSQSEFLAMLIRAYTPTDFTPVSDPTNWDKSYIDYAVHMGWKTTAPNKLSLSRGTVSLYLTEATGKNYNMNDAIQYLLDLGVSNGKTSNSIDGFEKDAAVTRAEAVTFIERLKQKFNQLSSSPATEQKYNRHVAVNESIMRTAERKKLDSTQREWIALLDDYQYYFNLQTNKEGIYNGVNYGVIETSIPFGVGILSIVVKDVPPYIDTKRDYSFDLKAHVELKHSQKDQTPYFSEDEYFVFYYANDRWHITRWAI